MPPRDPKPAISRPKSKSKPKLDVPEPTLTAMLEKYCDLRRRGFGQQAIQTKAKWPRHYPSLLLKEAQRRETPGSQQSQQQAVTEWLLAMFDAGTELRVIQRMSALTDEQSKSRLKAALDAASGPAPTGLIIRNPDGEPTRVSWLDTNGELMHRPFDGAFPANYPADLAVRQCTEVACRLLVYPNNSARDRAHTMLYMAEYRATTACRVLATAAAVGSPHEFVSTPHVHRCRPATVCRCARASVRLVSSLKGGKPPLDSLSASACPQRKDLGHSPVFAIGPRAV